MDIITSNALGRLNALSRRAQSIQAAIAYWCFPPSRLDGAFVAALGHPDGYLCGDLHPPTSVDCLVDLKAGGANLYLHLFQLVGRTEVPDSKGIPDHLMHSKVLVFDSGASEIAIWIGSHNATARALTGINYECAVVIHTERDSSLHRQTIKHLEDVRRRSTVFRAEDADYYRWLQGGLDVGTVVELEDKSDGKLPDGTQIMLFGTDECDHQALKTIGKTLTLSVSNMSSGVETLYKVSVEQSGKLEPKGAKKLTFGDQRYAFKSAASLPTLGPHQPVELAVYKSAVFYASLKIDQELTGFIAIEVPSERPWRDVEVEAFLSRKDDSAYQGLTKGGKWRIQRADRVSEENPTELTARASSGHGLELLSLTDRKGLQSRSLFRKRLLVDNRKKSDADDLPGILRAT
jgi:hypothetical protein